MLAGARGASGGDMAWSARPGKPGLYCFNEHRSELAAAPVSEAELVTLAACLWPNKVGSSADQVPVL